MADLISSGELGRRPGQGKLDLLIVGDATRYFLAGSVQKFFSNTAQITLTISNVKKVVALLATKSFDIIFLKVTSTLSMEEQEVVKLIRSEKKKNQHLLFVFIIPEKLRGYFSEYGADISFSEPLTLEKVNIVVKYWEEYCTHTVDVESTETSVEYRLHLRNSCSELGGHFPTDAFVCSELLKSEPGLGLKAQLPSPEGNRRASALHSSKEKLRRERIKFCCEQLRTLLPYVKGRKSDVASVIEATVDYVKHIRETISPAIMAQITESLQSNKRFSKRQMPIELFLPCAATSQRENGMLTSTYSPVQEIQLLADQCLNVYTMPAVGPSEEAVRGQSGSGAESPVEDLHNAQVPGAALSLNSYHAVRYCSGPVSPHDAADRANQDISTYLPSTVPTASNFLPQHCNSVLCQVQPTSPNCLYTPGHELPASSRAASSSTLRELQEPVSDHQASQQPLVSTEPSLPPQENSYFYEK
ncbi:spermatogenesis- and oogenesis-specific basic helix-loop-helix-containing protein 2 [Meriones unguiculatus]|uniref:spermatogenesis- and oogenesis-specific basic helix-loop-helix-containing protein 2 n=1 Tax=Meriones unguiculatus TaxID=10047 RepID=UPI00293EAAF1|nr:spermatogenesis- and oogenesis-specific basic helix-loop-helix-containing protein 2 [Meriones unguiculatus]